MSFLAVKCPQWRMQNVWHLSLSSVLWAQGNWVAPKCAENELVPVQHGLITVAEVYNINLCQIWPLITVISEDSTLTFSSIKINIAFQALIPT